MCGQKCARSRPTRRGIGEAVARHKECTAASPLSPFAEAAAAAVCGAARCSLSSRRERPGGVNRGEAAGLGWEWQGDWDTKGDRCACESTVGDWEEHVAVKHFSLEGCSSQFPTISTSDHVTGHWQSSKAVGNSPLKR